jgi:hypothetical protein
MDTRVMNTNSSLMLPTFVVPGAPRSGSTWLYAVLSHHPGISLPDIKEPDFFNRRILTEDPAGYFDLYRRRAAGSARTIRGDMSVNYSILRPPAVAQVGRVLSGARVVYTIRNPVERLWSQLKYDYTFFSHRPLTRIPLMRFLRECESPRLTRRNEYLQVIRDWSNAFGDAAMHVELFDRIEQDPIGYVRDILRHIGADPNFQIPSELLSTCVNATAEREMPGVLRWYLSAQWLPPTERLNDYLGGAVSHWVQSMREEARAVTGSRRVVRALNRAILSLPYRLAYKCYDRWRHRALMRRYTELFPVVRSPNSPSQVPTRLQPTHRITHAANESLTT